MPQHDPILDLRNVAEVWADERLDAEMECEAEQAQLDAIRDEVLRTRPRWPRLMVAHAQAESGLDADPDEFQRQVDEPYESLCSELGIDTDPDALAGWADSYDPTLISEDYFERYAEELAEDIGAIPHDAQWPANRIDWEAAADDLRQDYMTVTFDGNDYLIRS